MAGPVVSKISIDNESYDPALKELSSACGNLCNTDFTIPDRLSDSPTLTKYEEKFTEIENVLKLYKKLVQKQIQSLKKIQGELVAADNVQTLGNPLSSGGIPLPYNTNRGV